MCSMFWKTGVVFLFSSGWFNFYGISWIPFVSPFEQKSSANLDKLSDTKRKVKFNITEILGNKKGCEGNLVFSKTYVW